MLKKPKKFGNMFNWIILTEKDAGMISYISDMIYFALKVKII